MLSRLSAVAAGLALVLASTAAQASGPHEGGRCGGGAFAGSYIGINLGYASGETEFSSTTDPKKSFDDGSFTIGGHAGHNFQCDRTVFGIEGDIAYLGIENESTVPSNPLFGPAPVQLKSEMNWFGTLRGRLGVLLREDMMVYATAGLAFADVDHKVHDPNIAFRQSNSSTQTGWTVGGGIELLRDSRWMLRVEALYVDLGDEKHTYTVGAPCVGVCTETGKWEDDFWVARVGFSYKFGVREQHVPLK